MNGAFYAGHRIEGDTMELKIDFSLDAFKIKGRAVKQRIFPLPLSIRWVLVVPYFNNKIDELHPILECEI